MVVVLNSFENDILNPILIVNKSRQKQNNGINTFLSKTYKINYLFPYATNPLSDRPRPLFVHLSGDKHCAGDGQFHLNTVGSSMRGKNKEYWNRLV